MQLRNQIAEPLGERRDSRRLLRPAWCASSDIDQNDREITLTKGINQSAGSLNHPSDRMDKGGVENAFLKINNNKGGLWIKRCNGHQVLLLDRDLNER